MPRHRHGFLPDPEIEPDGLQIPGYLACDARFGGGKRNRLGEQQPLGRPEVSLPSMPK